MSNSWTVVITTEITSENVVCFHQSSFCSGQKVLLEIKETRANKVNQDALLSVQDHRESRGAAGRWALLDQKGHVRESGYFYCCLCL